MNRMLVASLVCRIANNERVCDDEAWSFTTIPGAEWHKQFTQSVVDTMCVILFKATACTTAQIIFIGLKFYNLPKDGTSPRWYTKHTALCRGQGEPLGALAVICV